MSISILFQIGEEANVNRHAKTKVSCRGGKCICILAVDPLQNISWYANESNCFPSVKILYPAHELHNIDGARTM